MFPSRVTFALIVLSTSLVFSGCGGSSGSPATPNNPQVVQKGTRTLALDAFIAASSDPSPGLAKAKTVGAQSVTQLITWTMIETSPNVYDVSVLQPAANLLPGDGLSLSLMIAVINTTVIDMPSDLKGLPFDDPRVIARFETLLDHIFGVLQSVTIASVGIGNEVDAYLSTPTAWSQYTNFYAAAAGYLHSKHPGVAVGVQGTLYGMLGEQSQFNTLGQSSDVYLVSYYPLNPDFTVKDPSVVSTDLNNLVTAFPNKPIQFREAGYPTGSVVNSSTTQQAQFVSNVFTAWDQFPSHITFICFTRLNDKTDAETALDAQYYGTSDPKFLTFDQTLGLRTSSGIDKPGMTTLSNQAQARGW